MRTNKTSTTACVQIGAVVAVPAMLTLVADQVGFGYTMMWWATAVITVGLMVVELTVTCILAKINERIRTGKVECTPTEIPYPWHEKGVITTLFILCLLLLLDMNVLMILYACVYGLSQLVVGGLSKTLTKIKEQNIA